MPGKKEANCSRTQKCQDFQALDAPRNLTMTDNRVNLMACDRRQRPRLYRHFSLELPLKRKLDGWRFGKRKWDGLGDDDVFLTNEVNNAFLIAARRPKCSETDLKNPSL